MKKLTAGIFATILGLTTVNAFAATAGTKVASTNYVDGAVVAAKAYTDTKVGDIKIPSLEGYAKETWVEDKGYAVATKVAEDIAAAVTTAASDATSKADAAQAAAIAAAATDATTKADAAQAAAIAAAATDATTKADKALSDAKTWVGQQNYLIEANISNLATKTEAEGFADAAQAAAAADATTKADAAQAAAIAAAATDATTKADAAQAAAIAAAATDATNKANTAEANAKAYTDAEIGEIGEMTVKQYVDNAKSAATYDDKALKGRVTANETAISGNTSAISTLQTEQGTQNTAIAKAQADATQALDEVQAEQDVNAAQQVIISELPTTYVKLADVVDSYPASN